MWNETALLPIAEKICCPTFVIAGGRPYLSVLGVVWTDRFIVQRLTDIMWLGEARTYEDGHLYQLARTFTALRHCQNSLNTFYDDLLMHDDLVLIPNEPHPRYFPYPTSFIEHGSNSTTSFKYLDVMEDDSTNVAFQAETISDPPKKVIVKFVDRYGVLAHTCLADYGMAPNLLYCGLLNGKDDCPLRMVVMDFIEGENAQKTSPAAWPLDTRAQIKEALANLHRKGLVFGDLRPPNIMFTRSKVILIDFDWAGPENQVRYPKGLSSHVQWPEGARDFQLITRVHDMAMLDAYFPDRT
ncbi:hypothetical protein SERLA73DRAFT_118067 [Serpula lacrymans var. lacrymans S7.3]|uniref:Aminoglycoside phosphotransferase domain-containing protein n=1 Tax=Serpula lacrymans var. lacrymans (strain S7.3) TaxID=936435 RepID=F8QII1_SERL3|nr:hypothetical protein SERLA73DRAFT_118067 [Serpula lacrymans var. lacrymans S7.3]